MASVNGRCKKCNMILGLDTAADLDYKEYEELFIKCPICKEKIELTKQLKEVTNEKEN